PTDANLDKDNDGMPNLWEYQNGLNASDPTDANLDKDNDNLSNLAEYEYGTNATLWDTDGDNMPDGWEYIMGFDGTDPADANLDKDNDGMPNLWEYQNGLNASDPTDGDWDNDGDLLPNNMEYEEGTDPNNSDTDKDSYPDGSDPWPLNRYLPFLLYFGLIITTITIISLGIYIIYLKKRERIPKDLEEEEEERNYRELYKKIEEYLEENPSQQLEIEELINKLNDIKKKPSITNSFIVMIISYKIINLYNKIIKNLEGKSKKSNINKIYQNKIDKEVENIYLLEKKYEFNL
ncbi:MAG: hypothetical protein ACTSRZ_19535, partial [Promethearchaeota archaeon]